MPREKAVFLLLPLLVTALGVPVSAGEGSTTEAMAEDMPSDDGFQQLLARGAIAALVDPEFVAAAEAEIPDDAWVLGFAHSGEAYAYDLNLLNSHEVVNHRVAGSAFAAVW